MIGGLFWNIWDGKRQWIRELFDAVGSSMVSSYMSAVSWVLHFIPHLYVFKHMLFANLVMLRKSI